VLLPLQVDFPMNAVENPLLSVQQKRVLFRLCYLPKFLDLFYLLGHLPLGMVSAFCLVWMQSFLFLLRSCLSSCVAVLSNLLLSAVCNHCQPLQSLLFSSILCLTNIGQPYVLSVSVCSGVAFQPAHCTVSLKNLTAASIASSV
jgi:hypothetical protein